MTSRTLPAVEAPEAWDSLHARSELFTPALAVIAARHALDLSNIVRSARGTSPVFLARLYAVKLIPPPWVAELAFEVAALERAHGKLPVRTPAVVATGVIDDWRYLVTETIPGVSLREVLTQVSPRALVSIAERAGETLAALHRVSCDGLAALTPDWDAFARERAEVCVAFQRKHKLGEDALAAIPAILDQGTPWVPDGRRGLLHADLHHEHVLLEARGDEWELTGVLDFGDTVVGHPEYDLITPAFFVARGQPGASRALFEAAGFRCDERASRRLMAWSVMHRYNALARFLDGAHDAAALESLRLRYWPVLA